jgi:hypothetical protein
MPQTMVRRPTTENYSGQVLETRESACPIDHDAVLAWLMPCANSLTRAITTAILARHGLLEDCSASRGRAACSIRLSPENACGQEVPVNGESRALKRRHG